MKKLFSNLGFSLVEVLVGVGLVGGISLVSMKLMEDHTTNQSYLKARAEIEKTTGLIAAQFADRSKCNAFFNNAIVPVTVGPTNYLDRIISGDRILLRQGTPGNPVDYGEFLMDEETIRVTESNPPNPNRVDLTITFRLKNMKFKKATQETDSRLKITKSIPFQVVRVAGTPNKVAYCGERIGDAEVRARKLLCESLGAPQSNGLGNPQSAFVWNNVTNQCDPVPRICAVGQVMGRVSSLGGYICRPASDAVDLDSMFEFAPDVACGTKGFKLTHAGGKIAIRCNP